MPALPKITAKKLINLLQKIGFKIARSKGSHFVLKRDDGRMTVIPVHSGETIGPGLMKRVLQDCDLTKGELIKLLEK